MEHIKGIIDNDLHVVEDVFVRGQVNGNVIVEAGMRFTIEGQIRGNIRIERDAVVRILGIITGDLQNNGGRVSIEAGSIIHGESNVSF